jgi:hypothetical protein
MGLLTGSLACALALSAEFLALKYVLEPVVDLDFEVLLLGSSESRISLETCEPSVGCHLASWSLCGAECTAVDTSMSARPMVEVRKF